MHTTNKPIGFWSAVSMGIGAMVGAGIFALLGEASAIAGSAVYISFIIGGLIAMLSAYSLGKLGATYPSSGGIVEYLSQAFGVGTFTGSMSIMLYFAAVVSLSLIAKAFGNYATTFMSNEISGLWRTIFTTGIVIFFVLLNLKGARDVAVWERLTVGLKFLVLLAALFSLTAMLLALYYVSRDSLQVLYILAAFVVTAVVTELLLQKFNYKIIKLRIPQLHL